MSTNWDTLFYDTSIIEDFVKFNKEKDKEYIAVYGYNDYSFDEFVGIFIDDMYWGEINKYFMNPDNTNDISLLMYIKNNDDNDIYEYVIEYMNKTDNICYIREKIYQNALMCKLFNLEEKIKEKLNN